MSRSAWKVELDLELTERKYELREKAEKNLGKRTYSNGYHWCLSLRSDGKVCYKKYKSELSLDQHVKKKHSGCNLPGKERPKAIVEEISTKFSFKDGIFRFIDG